MGAKNSEGFSLVDLAWNATYIFSLFVTNYNQLFTIIRNNYSSGINDKNYAIQSIDALMPFTLVSTVI